MSLLIFACAIRVAYYALYARHLSISGDEKFYLLKAIDIANYIKSFVPFLDVKRVVPDLVQRGLFLPGMSIVMVPFFIFSDGLNNLRSVLYSDGLAHLRLYMGALNFYLLVFIVHQLGLLFGRHVARVAAALAACFPIYIAFSYTFWGETLGSELLLLYLLFFIGYARRIGEGQPIDYYDHVMMGIFLACILYIRPSFIFVLPATAIIIVTIHLRVACTMRSLMKASLGYLVLVLVVLLGLSPWSYAVSKKHGGLYLTTTSAAMVFPYVYAKGELRRKIFEPNKDIERNAWHRMYYNYWQQAKAKHTSFYHVAKVYEKAALASVTFGEYVRHVKNGIRGFFFNENQFLNRFIHHSIRDGSAHIAMKMAAFHSFKALNSVFWYALLVLCIPILCMPWSVSGCIEAWWLAVPFRLAFCSITVQPFLVGASGRYYEALIILCITAVAIASRVAKKTIYGELTLEDLFSYHERGVFMVVQWLLPMVVIIPVLFLILVVY